MKRKSVFFKATFGLATCALASLVMINQALADGTEQLGPPSIPIAPGSDIIVEGVGLTGAQTGDITVIIPSGVSIEQVLLYWSGRSVEAADAGNDDTIQVNGMDVTAPRIGGPTLPPYPSNTYRADITATSASEGWIVAGQTNVISVGGLDFTYRNDGAAVVVILDNGSSSDIQIMDGNDFAYLPHGYQTVPVEFPVTPSSDPQLGTLWLMVSDVAVPRPAAVEIVVGGVTNWLDDVLHDNEGDSMDVVELDVPIPAGVTNVIVRVLSIEKDALQPASLAWSFVAWTMPVPHTECGGGGLTPGFWQNKHGIGLIDEYGALADLNELCLRNDDGEHADFTTLQEFRAWLKSRNAENMAYQLSGHLAAMFMNVLVGSVNGDALVYIGGEGDMISIYNLLDAANEALCEDGETFSGDENHDYQEMLKDALDKANNNQNWVYPCICHY